MSDDLQSKTIQDFGDQWGRYTENDGFYGSGELFADMVSPLLDPQEIKDSVVADIGSGTGRIVNMLLREGARTVHAMEPSADAFAALKQNTAVQSDRIVYRQAPGEALPSDLELDYAFSIGVIHHIPKPEMTMRACFQALKGGGRCLIWLYGKEGNETYLALILPLRWLTVRLPHRLLAGLCHLLNVCLDGYIAACRVIPLPLRGYVRNVLAKMTREKRYLIIYDQLNPAYAKYYSEEEARALLTDAGFVDVKTHHRHGYSWTVIGTRPALAKA